MRSVVWRLISPSSMKYFHSGAGTMISAFGNAGLLSGVSSPLMWSPWMWEMMTTSTWLRSMPDAFRLAWNCPAAPLLFLKFASPVPVSITTSRDPVFTAHGQYGIAIMSGAGCR